MMIRILCGIMMCCVLLSCGDTADNEKVVEPLDITTQIGTLNDRGMGVLALINNDNIEEIERLFVQPDEDKLYVTHLWATWCEPCLDELPKFKLVYDQYKDNDKVQFLFINLDRLAPNEDLIKLIDETFPNLDFPKHNVHLPVEGYERWGKIFHQDWYGALPATSFSRGKQNIVIENKMTEGDITRQMELFLK